MVYTVDVDVPAAEMYRNFTAIGYWEDLVAFYRDNDAQTEIAHFATGDSGTDVAFKHILSARDLPPIARPVLPGTFVITREQHFDPFDEATNSARGSYRTVVPAVPTGTTSSVWPWLRTSAAWNAFLAYRVRRVRRRCRTSAPTGSRWPTR